VNRDFEVVAHRGASWRPFDNTIVAFRQAAEAGATAIELDVRLTRDNEPIVVHTRFGSNRVADVLDTTEPLTKLTWKDITRLRIRKSGLPVPHLREVLLLANDLGLKCYIEPKEATEALLERIQIALLDTRRTEKDVFITFLQRSELLRLIRRHVPDVRINVIVVWPFSDWVAQARRFGASIVTLGWSRVNQFRILDRCRLLNFERKIERAHQYGVLVMGGYGDTVADLHWLLNCGCDGVFTNRVPVARQAAESWYRWERSQSA
jgi:glycerophosphoryl diester phosphodiesterase